MDRATQILILNYNAGNALVDCLQSLAASDARDCPTLVVDNNSSDGSIQRAKCRFANMEVLQLSSNVGFAAGVNAGLEKLEERTFAQLLLLNPDTKVTPRFLAPLLATLARGAAIAGPKLLSHDEAPTIWCAGGEVTFGLNLTRLRGHREPDQGQYDGAEDVSFLPATVWLMNRTVIETVGGFDEQFFCYVEDVDYCLRVRNSGLRLRYEPASTVYHAGSLTSGGGYTSLRKYLNALGSWTLLRKHGTAGRWFKFVLCDVLTTPLALCYGTFRRRPKAALWKIRGLVDGWQGRQFDEQRRRELMAGLDV